MAEPTVLDVKSLAKELKPLLADPVADEQDLADGTELVDGEVIYTDPTAKTCDEMEAKALNSLPMGQGIYRGKNGTQLINHSQESLEAIAAYRRNRRQFRTRSRI